MKMKMLHCLSSELPIINDNSKALLQLLLLGNFTDSQHQVTQNRSILLLGLTQSREISLGLWYQQNMKLGHWIDIPKGKTQLVLVDNLGRNLSGDNSIKNGHFIKPYNILKHL